MTRPFSVALKHQMVARLTGVNAVSAAQLARETGISQTKSVSMAESIAKLPAPGGR